MEKLLQIIIALTGIVPYILLVRGIIKGNDKVSFATWLLWLALDCIMLREIIVQNGNPLLYTVFTIGTFIVAVTLIVKKQFSWGEFESFISALVAVCIVVHFASGPYIATIATATALSIAGIPQIVKTYRNPSYTPTVVYLLFAISSFVSVTQNNIWTVPEKLPPINSMIFCVIVTLLSLRKVYTPHKKSSSAIANDNLEMEKMYLDWTPDLFNNWRAWIDAVNKAEVRRDPLDSIAVYKVDTPTLSEVNTITLCEDRAVVTVVSPDQKEKRNLLFYKEITIGSCTYCVMSELRTPEQRFLIPVS